MVNITLRRLSMHALRCLAILGFTETFRVVQSSQLYLLLPLNIIPSPIFPRIQTEL